MSWSLSAGPVPIGELEAALNAATVHGTGNDPAAQQRQVDEAKADALKLAKSGAVGGHGKKFYVNLSGHANKDHEPQPGWANDTVTVSVSQAAEHPVSVLPPAPEMKHAGQVV